MRVAKRFSASPFRRRKSDRILEGIGLEKLGGTGEQSTWKIPSHRSDLRREVDLIEEVVRVYGIGRIPSSTRSCFSAVSVADRRYDFESETAAAAGRARFLRSPDLRAGRAATR